MGTPRRLRRWTENHDRRLIKLHRRGYADGVIARKLDVNLSTICIHRNRLGLTPNKHNRRQEGELNWEPSQRRIAAMTAVFRRRVDRIKASACQVKSGPPRAYTLLLEWCEVGVHAGNQGTRKQLTYGKGA